MNKIGYIIRREYMVRVRKRTFWILTLLIPFFYVGLIGSVAWMNKSAGPELQHVNIIDKSGLFKDAFKDNDHIKYIYHSDPSLEGSLIEMLTNNENVHVLVIPEIDVNDPKGFMLTSSKKSSAKVVDALEYEINNRIKDIKLKNLKIDKTVLESLETNVIVERKIKGEEGLEKDYTDVASGIGFLAAFLNYMFIFIYGSMVLRGVHEEKSNRIVEIVISSVKPFELMFGKVVGVAMVGLTQFLLWVLLIAVVTILGSTMQISASPEVQHGLSELFAGINSLPLMKIILMFIFYFVGGYLLYSSLFASIAASVDNQSDLQQFMWPLTVPLIIAIVAMQPIIENPNSALATWMSIIPFTAPISMMGRVAFEISPWELITSMLLLVATFMLTTWIAAKIYRIGILIYGTKVSYKDLIKWLFYK